MKQRHMYNNQEDIIDWWSKGRCTIIRKISYIDEAKVWLLYMYFYFISLCYLPDYCTSTFASLVYDIFLIIVHLHLLHQSMISSWLLYIYLCFTSLWYLPHYCTCAFDSPLYDLFLIIVHVGSLHQFMISSWLVYMYLCFTFLWFIDWWSKRYMYNNQEDIIDWWSKGRCTIIRKIS
jgi:hypothetical protein